MTIAAGLKCSDGVVLCADTEMSIPGWIKFPGTKIRLNRKLTCAPAYTFSGHVRFCEMLISKINQAIIKAQAGDQTVDPIPAVENTIFEIHQKFKDEQKEQEAEVLFSLLGKVGSSLKRSLFHISQGMLVPVSSVCIGTGQLFAQGVITNWYNSTMTVREAAILSIILLTEAKAYGDGCGKDSQILMLTDKGDCIAYHQEDFPFEPRLSEIEEEYKTFQQILRPLMLEFGHIAAPPDKLRLIIQEFAGLLLRRRSATHKKYKKMEEDWQEAQIEDWEAEEKQDKS